MNRVHAFRSVAKTQFRRLQQSRLLQKQIAAESRCSLCDSAKVKRYGHSGQMRNLSLQQVARLSLGRTCLEKEEFPGETKKDKTSTESGSRKIGEWPFLTFALLFVGHPRMSIETSAARIWGPSFFDRLPNFIGTLVKPQTHFDRKNDPVAGCPASYFVLLFHACPTLSYFFEKCPTLSYLLGFFNRIS